MESLLLFALVANSVSGSPLTSYRAVILDVSGSMDAVEEADRRRIDIATSEIRDIATQLPPSQQYPIGLVLFNDTGVENEFTDSSSLDSFLRSIEPSGGTRISRGLKGGYELLERIANCGFCCVVLYTDGDNEPTDESSRQKQESLLDGLFNRRQQQGLATNGNRRRWANSNNDWIRSLEKKPAWGVIDAANFRISSITLAPVVSVQTVERNNQNDLVFELEGHVETNIRIRR